MIKRNKKNLERLTYGSLIIAIMALILTAVFTYLQAYGWAFGMLPIAYFFLSASDVYADELNEWYRKEAEKNEH